jgi:ubiquinone/menaquinone biosynthesis C-methylase UbiE
MNAPSEINVCVLTACPCCGGGFSDPFYEVGPVPVHSCLMLESTEEARSFPTGTVRLAVCDDCGFVANVAFDPAWSAYAPSYEDQQSFSPSFNSFAGALAVSLVTRYGLHGKRAVEVGCSKGDFMALLCEAGGMETIGIDPSALDGRVAKPSKGSMRFLAEYYAEAHLAFPADLICCRHTLEHIQPVHDTLVLMRRHAELTPGAVLCIEVPDAARVWRDCAFEDIYYEHCSYFTAGSLAAALRRAGFSVADLRREYGGQYLVAVATLDPRDDRRFAIEETPAENRDDIISFRRRVDGVKTAWTTCVDQARRDGRSVAIWGSGSKCVAFLKATGGTRFVDAIVDINPHRDGKVAPGLDKAIRRPEALKSIRPGLVVVMNAVYRDEITDACKTMGLDPEILALGDVPGSGA